MNYFYLVGGIAVLLLLVCTVLIIYRRRRARYLVSIRADQKKWEDLNNAISPFGFCYDLCGDYFYAVQDAWQRKMGYSEIYDQNAIRMNMFFDCEPIYFSYRGKSYLLELWKGQYGITTGAEIGFYVSDKEDLEHPERLFYDSVSDEEMLPMHFILKKQGEVILECRQMHWWLTGFVLGEFSWPEELSLEVAITFPNYSLRNAFYEAMVKRGYTNMNVNGAVVSFVFDKPFAKQPKHTRLRIWWVQRCNRLNCKSYLKVTRGYVRTLDRVDYLGMCFPRVYRLLGRMSHMPSVKRYRKEEKKYEHR